MFVAERDSYPNLVKDYGNHPVSTDGGIWYPQTCEFLKMDHHIHSSLEKSLIERKICNKSKIKPKFLMTISHVENKTAN